VTRREQIFEHLKRPPLSSHMKWLVMDDVVAEKIYGGEIGQLYGVKIVRSSHIDSSFDEDSQREDLC